MWGALSAQDLMQTFLPVADFKESARILDYRRLGKQRLEAKQIHETLKNGGGWKNHPAVRMWRGYEAALRAYYNAVVTEWVCRGYKNTMPLFSVGARFSLPHWFGLEEFHASHRSNLLRKNFEHYSQFGWLESPDLPYCWPEGKR